jgi:hypothetical protein
LEGLGAVDRKILKRISSKGGEVGFTRLGVASAPSTTRSLLARPWIFLIAQNYKIYLLSWV